MTTKTTKKTAKAEKTETAEIVETVATAPEVTMNADAPTEQAAPEKRVAKTRTERPACEPGELLVRDVRLRLLDCQLECAHPDVFGGTSDVIYMKGNKSDWKRFLKDRDPNEKMKASFDGSTGVLRIG